MEPLFCTLHWVVNGSLVVPFFITIVWDEIRKGWNERDETVRVWYWSTLGLEWLCLVGVGERVVFTICYYCSC